MQDRFLTKRVEVLENTLLGPDGVVEQLGLIRAELSAMRQETAAGFVAVRREMNERFDAERRQTTDEFAAVRQAITQVDVHMRLLHEDALDRIANSRRELTTDTPSVKRKSTSTSRRKTR